MAAPLLRLSTLPPEILASIAARLLDPRCGPGEIPCLECDATTESTQGQLDGGTRCRRCLAPITVRDRTSLKNLSCVNRSIRDAVRPILFRNICLTEAGLAPITLQHDLTRAEAPYTTDADFDSGGLTYHDYEEYQHSTFGWAELCHRLDDMEAASPDGFRREWVHSVAFRFRPQAHLPDPPDSPRRIARRVVTMLSTFPKLRRLIFRLARGDAIETFHRAFAATRMRLPAVELAVDPHCEFVFDHCPDATWLSVFPGRFRGLPLSRFLQSSESCDCDAEAIVLRALRRPQLRQLDLRIAWSGRLFKSFAQCNPLLERLSLVGADISLLDRPTDGVLSPLVAVWNDEAGSDVMPTSSDGSDVRPRRRDVFANVHFLRALSQFRILKTLVLPDYSDLIEWCDDEPSFLGPMTDEERSEHFLIAEPSQDHHRGPALETFAGLSALQLPDLREVWFVPERGYVLHASFERYRSPDAPPVPTPANPDVQVAIEYDGLGQISTRLRVDVCVPTISNETRFGRFRSNRHRATPLGSPCTRC